MDREEAKTELQDLTNAIEELENRFPIKNPANQKTITALKIAIEALEQPALDLFTELSIKAIGEDEIYRIIKKEKEREKKLAANRCEDAISRQAVLDGLEKYHEGADLHIDGLTYAYDLVCKLPSVSTEKVGRWKKKNPFWKSVCSECGESAIGYHGFDETLTKYCPNCGSRMMEVEE